MGRTSGERKGWKHPIRDILLTGVVLVVAALGYAVFWAFTARPSRDVDYAQRMREVVDSRQRGVERGGGEGWAHYLEALRLFRSSVDGLQGRIVPGGIPPLPGDFMLLIGGYEEELRKIEGASDVVAGGERAALDARLELARSAVPAVGTPGLWAALERLSGADRAGRREFEVGADEPMMLLLLPDLGEARGLSRFLAARMRMAGGTGDSRTVLDGLEHVLAISWAMGHQGTLIERLVAMAIARMGLEEICRYADTGSMNADEAREALALIDRLMDWPGMEMCLEFERLLALDLVQETHSSGGPLGGRLLTARMSGIGFGQDFTVGTPPSPIMNLAGLAAPTKAETTLAIDRFYDGVIGNAAMRPRDRREGGFSAEAFIAALPRSQVILAMIAPSVDRTLDSWDGHRTVVDGTRLRLAVEIFHVLHERYPATLDELVPGVLPALPRDFLAPDERFVYRVEGESFILYSVGLDGQDDGGVTGVAERNAALSSKAGGLDYVIHAPPRSGGASPASP